MQSNPEPEEITRVGSYQRENYMNPQEQLMSPPSAQDGVEPAGGSFSQHTPYTLDWNNCENFKGNNSFELNRTVVKPDLVSSLISFTISFNGLLTGLPRAVGTMQYEQRKLQPS